MANTRMVFPVLDDSIRSMIILIIVGIIQLIKGADSWPALWNRLVGLHWFVSRKLKIVIV